MRDIEYVKEVLSGEYRTERTGEIPYPDLQEVIRVTSFEYLAGSVDLETPNGSVSREGKPYFWFKHGGKSILSHRFIAAVTLGKWVPRDFDVDHVNHDPSDNRPINLRIVTRRDNAGNRRQALLSDLADLEAVAQRLEEMGHLDTLDHHAESTPLDADQSLEWYSSTASSTPFFTGETKPSEFGGTWYKNSLGSWHLIFD